MSLSQRVLGAVDLAIEFATLGEYGLEEIDSVTPVVAGDRCRRERSGHARRMPSRAAVEAPAVAGWGALAPARRRRCDAPLATACHSAGTSMASVVSVRRGVLEP